MLPESSEMLPECSEMLPECSGMLRNPIFDSVGSVNFASTLFKRRICLPKTFLQ